MKFIHVGGDIADFDGYTFMFKNPVDVTNQYTIDRLMKNPKFIVVESSDVSFTQLNDNLNRIMVETKVTASTVCKKCGKQLKQGIYLHEKYCKG